VVEGRLLRMNGSESRGRDVETLCEQRPFGRIDGAGLRKTLLAQHRYRLSFVPFVFFVVNP
jgi:hypothetical protein